MLAIPLALPEGTNWSSWGDFSPSIMSGATSNSLATDDWRIAMEWLKQNTPENSVIAAWWDYGYWITTLSDRTTIVDNATVGDFQIKKVAYAFTTNPAKAWHILGSDYNTDISNSLGNENIITVTILDASLTQTELENSEAKKFEEKTINKYDLFYVECKHRLILDIYIYVGTFLKIF